MGNFRCRLAVEGIQSQLEEEGLFCNLGDES